MKSISIILLCIVLFLCLVSCSTKPLDIVNSSVDSTQVISEDNAEVIESNSFTGNNSRIVSYKNVVYYTSYDSNIYKTDLSTNQTEKLVDNASIIELYQGKLFYNCGDVDYVMEITQKNTEKLSINNFWKAYKNYYLTYHDETIQIYTNEQKYVTSIDLQSVDGMDILDNKIYLFYKNKGEIKIWDFNTQSISNYYTFPNNMGDIQYVNFDERNIIFIYTDKVIMFNVDKCNIQTIQFNVNKYGTYSDDYFLNYSFADANSYYFNISYGNEYLNVDYIKINKQTLQKSNVKLEIGDVNLLLNGYIYTINYENGITKGLNKVKLST